MKHTYGGGGGGACCCPNKILRACGALTVRGKTSSNLGPSDPKPVPLPLPVSALISANESCLGEFIKIQVIFRDPELVALEGPKNLHSYQAPLYLVHT